MRSAVPSLPAFPDPTRRTRYRRRGVVRRLARWIVVWQSQDSGWVHLRSVMPLGRRRAPAGERAGLVDDDAFEDLYFRLADRLLVFFTRRTADPEIAADLWAETWSQALAKRDTFRGGTFAEQEGWVFGIARHAVAGYYKRGKAERRALGRLGLERPVLTDQDLSRLEHAAGLDELREALREALEDIPALQRAALQLRVVDGLGYPELARRLGITEDNARARVSRALRRLGDLLDPGLGPGGET
jgi:RNA polymerase sigma factor (sigma-70 family)